MSTPVAPRSCAHVNRAREEAAEAELRHAVVTKLAEIFERELGAELTESGGRFQSQQRYISQLEIGTFVESRVRSWPEEWKQYLFQHLDDILGAVQEQQQQQQQLPQVPSLLKDLYGRLRVRLAPVRQDLDRTRQTLKVVEEVSGPVAVPEPAGPGVTVPDPVRFAVFAPHSIGAGKPFTLDVWAFLDQQRAKVEDLATRMGEGRAGNEAEGRLAPTDRLSVFVHSPYLDIPLPVKPLTWFGQETVESFDCSLRGEIPYAGFRIPGTVVIALQGLLITEVQFELRSDRAPVEDREAVAQTASSPRTAFASYASDDRMEVMRSVQGIAKGAPSLDIFVDVDTLRSGDDWQRKLSAYISTSDILYLFWSSAASRSEWVGREWRMGLRAKGIAFIDPFPLTSPELVPPPAELKSLHFNDRYLMYILAQQQIESLKARASAQPSALL